MPKTGGVYHCAACDLPLFRAETKFESGTGWPSYDRPLTSDAVEERSDDSFGMHRVEVRCGRCDFGRLGGSVYQIEVPDDWNGRLVLYMHGYGELGPETNAGPPDGRRGGV